MRGAGAILYTNLVQKGWLFPHIVLSEKDEKFISDTEVNKY
jgi:hypothetical protein